MTVRKVPDLFKIALQRQHRAAQALVRHKQIGTVAEDEIRDIPSLTAFKTACNSETVFTSTNRSAGPPILNDVWADMGSSVL